MNYAQNILPIKYSPLSTDDVFIEAYRFSVTTSVTHNYPLQAYS